MSLSKICIRVVGTCMHIFCDSSQGRWLILSTCIFFMIQDSVDKSSCLNNTMLWRLMVLQGEQAASRACTLEDHQC